MDDEQDYEPEYQPGSKSKVKEILLAVLIYGVIGSGIGFFVNHHLQGVWHRQRVQAAKQAAADSAAQEKKCAPLMQTMSDASHLQNIATYGTEPYQYGEVAYAIAGEIAWNNGCIDHPTANFQEVTRICQEAEGSMVDPETAKPHLAQICLGWDQVLTEVGNQFP